MTAAINDLAREIRFLPGFLRDPDAEALLRVFADEFAWDRSIPDRPFARFGVPYGDDENREVVGFHPEVGPLLSRIEEEFGFRPDSCSVHWYCAVNPSWDFTRTTSKISPMAPA